MISLILFLAMLTGTQADVVIDNDNIHRGLNCHFYYNNPNIDITESNNVPIFESGLTEFKTITGGVLNCNEFPSISLWDTSRVTNMDSLFSPSRLIKQSQTIINRFEVVSSLLSKLHIENSYAWQTQLAQENEELENAKKNHEQVNNTDSQRDVDDVLTRLDSLYREAFNVWKTDVSALQPPLFDTTIMPLSLIDASIDYFNTAYRTIYIEKLKYHRTQLTQEYKRRLPLIAEQWLPHFEVGDVVVIPELSFLPSHLYVIAINEEKMTYRFSDINAILPQLKKSGFFSNSSLEPNEYDDFMFESIDTAISPDVVYDRKYKGTLIAPPEIKFWDVGNVKSMGRMFESSQTATDIDLSNWNVGNVENMSEMFASANSARDCSELFGFTGLANWDVSHVTEMYATFSNTNFNENIGEWNTEKLFAIGKGDQQNIFNVFLKAYYPLTFHYELHNGTIKIANPKTIKHAGLSIEGDTVALDVRVRSNIDGSVKGKIVNIMFDTEWVQDTALAPAFHLALNDAHDQCFQSVFDYDYIFCAWDATRVGFASIIDPEGIYDFRPFRNNSYIPIEEFQMLKYIRDNEKASHEAVRSGQLPSFCNQNVCANASAFDAIVLDEAQNGPIAWDFKHQLYSLLIASEGATCAASINNYLEESAKTNMSNMITTNTPCGIKPPTFETDNERFEWALTLMRDVTRGSGIEAWVIELQKLNTIRAFFGQYYEYDSMYSHMFTNAKCFNQDISTKTVQRRYENTINGTIHHVDKSWRAWDFEYARGINLESFFENALAFNQDISNWQMKFPVNFYRMFAGATSFTQPIWLWNLKPISQIISFDFNVRQFSTSRGRITSPWYNYDGSRLLTSLVDTTSEGIVTHEHKMPMDIMPIGNSVVCPHFGTCFANMFDGASKFNGSLTSSWFTESEPILQTFTHQYSTQIRYAINAGIDVARPWFKMPVYDNSSHLSVDEWIKNTNQNWRKDILDLSGCSRFAAHFGIYDAYTTDGLPDTNVNSELCSASLEDGIAFLNCQNEPCNNNNMIRGAPHVPLCQLGWGIGVGGSCTACPRNKYGDGRLCWPCPERSYQPLSGQSTCQISPYCRVGTVGYNGVSTVVECTRSDDQRALREAFNKLAVC